MHAQIALEAIYLEEAVILDNQSFKHMRPRSPFKPSFVLNFKHFSDKLNNVKLA